MTPDEIGRLVADLVRAELARVAPAEPATPVPLREAAKMLGMASSTLRKRVAAGDPRWKALVVDNGTARLLFDARKVTQFLQGGLR